jgi:hypothetical protein
MSYTRNRVIYAGNTILMSESPSWEDQTGVASLKSIRRVQSSNIEISTPVTRAKQVGSSDFTFQRYLQYPKISTSFSYYLTDNSNELIMGFITDGVTGCFKNFADFGKDQNIFYVLSNTNAEDFSDVGSLSGYDVMSIGNCFLTSYSINAAVGTIPTASASYDCLNILFQNYTGTGTLLPSIDLTGAARSTGTYALTAFNLNPQNYFSNQDDRPAALRPGDIVLQMQQPLIGGIRYTGTVEANITSVNVEIPLDRRDLVGFGSNYPYDKRLLFPIIGTLSFDGIFDKAVTGDFTQIFDDENEYDFSFVFKNCNGDTSYTVGVSNARVESQNFNLSIGDNMAFSSQFSFRISETSGFTLSGAAELITGELIDSINNQTLVLL